MTYIADKTNDVEMKRGGGMVYQSNNVVKIKSRWFSISLTSISATPAKWSNNCWGFFAPQKLKKGKKKKRKENKERKKGEKEKRKWREQK